MTTVRVYSCYMLRESSYVLPGMAKHKYSIHSVLVSQPAVLARGIVETQ